jgi:hypothetical protein
MELLGRNRAGCAGDRPAERPHSSAKQTRAHAFYPSLHDPKLTRAAESANPDTRSAKGERDELFATEFRLAVSALDPERSLSLRRP